MNNSPYFNYNLPQANDPADISKVNTNFTNLDAYLHRTIGENYSDTDTLDDRVEALEQGGGGGSSLYNLDSEFEFGTLGNTTVYGILTDASFSGFDYADVTLASNCSILYATAYIYNSSSSWITGLRYQSAYKVRVVADSSNNGTAKVFVLYTKVTT